MRSLLRLALTACALTGCKGPSYAPLPAGPAAGEQVASYDLHSSIAASRRGWYQVSICLENKTKEPLKLEPTMFALHAEGDGVFVQWANMAGGASTFRMPKTVVPNGAAQGRVLFRLEGDRAPPEHVALVVSLPDGPHRCEFARAEPRKRAPSKPAAAKSPAASPEQEQEPGAEPPAPKPSDEKPAGEKPPEDKSSDGKDGH